MLKQFRHNVLMLLRRPIIAFRLLRKYRSDTAFRRLTKYARFRHKRAIQGKWVLYESGHGHMMGGNALALFDALIRDPRFNKFTHVWALHDDRCMMSKWRALPNVRVVKMDSQPYLVALASAKYLINDSTFPPYFSRRPEQIYLNTWHGTPLKCMGKHVTGKPGQHKNVQRNFLHATHFASPNAYTTECFLNSIDLSCLFPGRILEQGSPRVDFSFSADVNAVRSRLGVPRGKKIVFYAPTWRGQNSIPVRGDDRFTDVALAIRAGCPDMHVVVRLHHWATKGALQGDSPIKEMLVPEHLDTNALLGAVDVLVTDYSSVLFDFLKMRKPIVYYVPDYAEYRAERGLYMSFEDLPGRTCHTLNELNRAIVNAGVDYAQQREAYETAIEKFASAEDGGACSRIIDEVFFDKRSGRSRIANRTGRKTLLFYGASLLDNGITSSLYNLLRSIDQTRYDVAIIDDAALSPEGELNALKCPDGVSLIYRCGQVNGRLRERFADVIGMSGGVDVKKKVHIGYYRNELRRAIGAARVDIFIDFSGYSKFWAALFLSSRRGRRVIYQHNDMLSEFQKTKHRARFGVIFQLYSKFDRVICVGKYTRQENVRNLQPYMANAEAQISLVYNCMDGRSLQQSSARAGSGREGGAELVAEVCDSAHGATTRAVRRPRPGEHVFITMGRLWGEKDHAKLIHAFHDVQKKHADARLYILGEGVLRAELEDMVDGLGLEGKVFLPGHLRNPFPLLRMADCFVLSSNYEGQPMVLLEAMAAGIPVLSTDIPGSRGAVECGYGRLVPNSADGLRDGMLEFLDGQWNTGQFSVEEYNAKALGMFYREVCGEE